MKTLNKVIAATMLMALTTAMPAMAGNKNNPRTREVTVRYDAKVTSARNIKHFMA